MTLGLSLFLALLQGAPVKTQTRAQAPAVFGVQVENVYLDAFVSEGHVPVKGLVASNFELKDNGVRQRLDLVSTEALPLLAVLAFDSSNSLAGERRVALLSAARAFLAALGPRDEVSLFAFAGEIAWLARPTTDKGVVGRALDRLQPGGATSVLDALYAALVLPQTRARTLVVLFTDGEDNTSWLSWPQMRRVAERSNALIHVVGLGKAFEGASPQRFANVAGRMLPTMGAASIEFLHTWSLRQIAESTGGRYWEAESPARLKAAFAAITETMAQRYILSYEPQGVARLGWHKIDLRLRGSKGEVHARRGYWVAGP